MADDISTGQYYTAKALDAAAQRFRDNVSSNALVNQYGPAYANPQMAAQAATANETTLLTPLKVSGETQRQNFLAQDQPLSVEAKQHANVLSGQRIAAGTAEAEQTAGAQNRQAIYGVFSGLEQDIANGRDPGESFDSHASTAAQATGQPIERINQLRGQFVNDPQGTLSGWKSSVPAAEYGTMNPTQRIAAQTANRAMVKGDLDAASARSEAVTKWLANKGVKSQEEAREKVGAWRGYEGRVGKPATTDDKGRTAAPSTGMIGDIDEALGILNKVPSSGWARSVSSYYPESKAGELNALLEKIGAGAGLQDLVNIKQAGGPGLRAVAEMEAAHKALINIKPGSRIGFIRDELNRIKTMMTPVSQSISERLVAAERTSTEIDTFFERNVRPPNINQQAPVNPSLQSPFVRQQQTQQIQQPATPPGTPTGTGTVTMPTPAPVQQYTPLPEGQRVPVAPVTDNSAQGARDAAAARLRAPHIRVLRADELRRKYGVND